MPKSATAKSQERTGQPLMIASRKTASMFPKVNPPGEGTSKSARKRRAAAARGGGAVGERETIGGYQRARAAELKQVQSWFLSPIAREYARTLADPFDGDLLGIPNEPSLYTRVDRVFAKGQIVTGTAGVGWIVADPLTAAGNDGICCVGTTNAFTGNSIDFAAAAGVATFTSNSSFIAANIGVNTVQVRVVSAGLRVRFAGALLNRGGRYVGGEHPSHANWNTNTTATMQSYVEVNNLPVIDEWTTILYRPVDTDDYDFSGTTPVTTLAGAIAAVQNFHMAFMVTAPNAATPSPIDFEFYANLEFQGNILQGKKPSLSDPVGANAVASTHVIAGSLRMAHQMVSSELAKRFVTGSNHYGQHIMSHPSMSNVDHQTVVDRVKNHIDSGTGFFGTALSVLGSLASLL